MSTHKGVRMQTAEVIAPDGVLLHVRESGPPDAPAILFIHGWSQSWQSWMRQMESELADRFRLVAYDLRGHGMSDWPTDPAAYNRAKPWADDVDAIITQRDLGRPVLVGWSFGGYVACDFIRAYGEERVAGVNFVCWAVMMGNTEKERALAGEGFETYFADATSSDLPTAIEAMRGFVRACAARELPAEELETLLAFNIIVPPQVRREMAMRGTSDNSNLLRTLTVPVQVTQGADDRVTRLAAAHHIKNCVPHADVRVYDSVGHMPFLEAPHDFNRELAEFAERAHAATPAR
ncbi:MAG TPA: alpha/beta hydrolase [Capillimicrobium sp.]|nr:alpha/beta hydrolase [Capillimicrobium sp.]